MYTSLALDMTDAHAGQSSIIQPYMPISIDVQTELLIPIA